MTGVILSACWAHDKGSMNPRFDALAVRLRRAGQPDWLGELPVVGERIRKLATLVGQEVAVELDEQGTVLRWRTL